MRSSSLVLKNDMSDHYPCLTSFVLESADVIYSNDETESLVINEKAKEQINNFLLHYNWSQMYEHDANESYDFLVMVINKAKSQFARVRTNTKSSRVSFTEPWMNINLLKYNRKCQRLCNKAKLNPSNDNVCRYHSYRKVLKRLKRHEKYVFYDKLFKKISNNSRSLWSVLNSLIGKTNNRTEITELLNS